MKVVQINAIYGEKSTGIIVRDLDLLLQKNKEESIVVYKDGNDNIENGIKVGNIIDWKMHAFRTRIDGKQSYSSKVSTRILIEKLDKANPDIIHLHNIHSNFLNLSLLVDFAKKNEITILLTLHDCWYFTGKCYHFADIGCEKWKQVCKQCPKRYMDIPSRYKDSSQRVFRDRCDLFDYDQLYVVGCSYWITDLARQSPILRKAQFKTIYNGVDTEIFCPAEHKEINKDFFTIVTMANKWFEVENAEVRNKVLEFIGNSGKLLIIGCTLENQQKYIEDSRVKTVGYIKDRKTLANYYAQADVFLNLTHIDNLPTVNMEALSCGTPVVTYDSGGSGELVEEGETGYRVKVDDVDQVIRSLDKVKQGNILRKNCRDYAVKNFDKNKNYQKYMNLYYEIVKDLGENTHESNI
ncbi:glycosyltransferase [Faecalicatena sp. Marseille-Q4148]|nr:glycosyltransferase [Faecalicatena sp. Marseille-Q4148]